MLILGVLWASVSMNHNSLVPHAGERPGSVAVLDIRKLSDYGERCLAASVQGLINSQPGSTSKVYLEWSDQDVMWLPWLKAQGYVKSVTFLKSLADLVKLSPTRKAVICGNSPFHIADIATTVAGCRRELLAVNSTLIAKYHLQADLDLRNKFQSNAEAYKWELANFRKEMNSKAISITVPDVTPSHNPANLRDYLLANRIFTFWISGPKEADLPGADAKAERKVLSEGMKSFPASIPCFGYPWSGDGYGPGEGGGVSFLSKFAKYLVATDTFDNLSFWSDFPASRKVLPQAGKVNWKKGSQYAASIVMSDGDNLCTFAGWFPALWQQMHDKGDHIPVGWTMGPLLRELAPPMFDYAVNQMPSGGSFGSGVSGVGYMAMDTWGSGLGDKRPAAISRFLAQTSDACRLSGEKWLWIMRYGSPGGWEINDYAQKVPGISAVAGGYGRVVSDPSQSIEKIGGVTVFHDFLNSNSPGEIEKELTSRLADGTLPRRFQIFLMNWSVNENNLAQLAKFCADHNIQLMTPDQLAEVKPPSG